MDSSNPFAPLHVREAFVETASLAEAIRRLGEGLGAREPFLLVTGEAGVGKTELALEAIARWEPRVTPARLGVPPRAGTELLEAVLRRFGTEPPEGATRARLVAAFESALGATARVGRVAMIVVDDAHELPAEVLDELRRLAGMAPPLGCPLEVMLVGLPALASTLDSPAHALLRQRVSVRVHVQPLSAADTQRYVHHRVGAAGGDGPGLFSRRTCREIAMRTGGVPRPIGLLASEALRVARAASAATVEPQHVRTAAAHLGMPDDAKAETRAAAVPVPAPDEVELVPLPEAMTREPEPAPPPGPVPGESPARSEPADVEPVAPAPTPPAPIAAAAGAAHDPQAWVARFIGDRGPVQISSQVFVSSGFVREPIEERCEAAAAPERAALAARRPRVRSRPSRPGRGRAWRSAPAIAMAVLVVVAAVAVTLRATHRGRGLAAAAADHAAPAPRRPAAVAPVPAAGTRERLVIAGSPERGLPEATPEPAPATAAADSARPGTRYTLDVGGYLELARALQERDRLQEATGIDAWVVPAAADGESHRVVLGIFRTAERATAAADQFLAASTTGEARVVPLPPRRARR
jgi:type II secretory pathway predicted ATPase ExeA